MSLNLKYIYGSLLGLFFAITGWAVSGLGGLKLALGIFVMFGLTMWVIIYALNELKRIENN